MFLQGSSLTLRANFLRLPAEKSQLQKVIRQSN